MILTTMYGKPTLALRAGNARGNDVIDAGSDVTVVFDEVTPEGHHIRRAYDLKLVRSRTPFFDLSWTIMHVIDEESPFYGRDIKNMGLMYIMVTLKAHDGTFGQTIYARHTYYPDDIKVGERFVDVISNKDDRIIVDYTKFHETTMDKV